MKPNGQRGLLFLVDSFKFTRETSWKVVEGECPGGF